MRKISKARFLAESAVIAAMYAVLTIISAPLSYGLFQIRISEALTVLPLFTPAAVPGLFVGCVIANLVGGNGPVDFIFGSLATLLAAVTSYKMPRRWLVPLPPVVINAVVVGFVLNYVLDVPVLVAMGWVALGEIVACYGLGSLLILQLEKIKDRMFK